MVYRGAACGTHKGNFMGLAPTGKQVTFTSIVISRIGDGKISRRPGKHGCNVCIAAAWCSSHCHAIGPIVTLYEALHSQRLLGAVIGALTSISTTLSSEFAKRLVILVEREHRRGHGSQSVGIAAARSSTRRARRSNWLRLSASWA